MDETRSIGARPWIQNMPHHSEVQHANSYSIQCSVLHIFLQFPRNLIHTGNAKGLVKKAEDKIVDD